MLSQLPNALTLCRLLLAIPLGMLILRGDYGNALWVGFLAGITDALDGLMARHLQAFSRFGAALDPIADKLLITVAVVSFAQVELIPWYVAITIVARDLVIVCGAITYHVLIGPFEFAATRLSKINMAVQIGFCFLVLAAQVFTKIPEALIAWTTLVAVGIAIISGLDYVMAWSIKALANHQQQGPEA